MKKIITTLMMLASVNFVACFDETSETSLAGYDVPEVNAAIASSSITVYYKANVQWIADSSATINMHYNADNAGWTTVPGVAMEKHTGQYDQWVGYASYTVTASALTFCFNKNGSEWDNNSGADYTISAPGVYTVVNGVVSQYTSAYGDIYYSHSDGVYPETIVAGFYVKLYKDGSSSLYASKQFVYSTTHGICVRFTGLPAGSYKSVVNENYEGMNYYGDTTITVAAGASYFSSGSIHLTISDPNAITIFYKANAEWIAGTGSVNCHYNNGSGWTTVPGAAMTKYTSTYDFWLGYASITVFDASALTFCFNYAGSSWDNNGSKDYSISSKGLYTVVNGVVTKLN